MSCDAAVESVLTADVCVVVDGSSDDEDGDSFGFFLELKSIGPRTFGRSNFFVSDFFVSGLTGSVSDLAVSLSDFAVMVAAVSC